MSESCVLIAPGPFRTALSQASIALEVNSVPWSEMIRSGLPAPGVVASSLVQGGGRAGRHRGGETLIGEQI